jgi:hypothetical protein
MPKLKRTKNDIDKDIKENHLILFIILKIKMMVNLTGVNFVMRRPEKNGKKIT